MNASQQAPDPQTIVEHSKPPQIPILAPGQAVILISPQKISAVASATVCILAGLYLLNTHPAKDNENNMIFIIAHGMGAYFIGKGIYCGSSLWSQAQMVSMAPLGVYGPPPGKPTTKWVQALMWVTGLLFAGLLVSSLLAAAYPARFTGPLQFWHQHLTSNDTE